MTLWLAAVVGAVKMKQPGFSSGFHGGDIYTVARQHGVDILKTV